MHAPKASAPSNVRHDGAHTGRAKRVMGRKMPDEHGPTLGIRRSAVLQIFGHSMSNIGGKGHLLITIALAVNTDRSCAPVDIVKPEPSNLPAP